MINKRINIFAGHYGSGKTEVAVNFALKLRGKFENVTIADLDIVNPYFRTADVKKTLEKKDISVITTLFANTNTDVPSLPAEINSFFDNDSNVVIDVGGDDAGARVLSRYGEYICKNEYRLYIVVNIKRPMTDTEEKIIEMIYNIEFSSGLKAGALINNTNLLQDTSADIILEGQRILEKVSEKLNIPIAFVSVLSDKINKVKGKINTELFIMEKMIRLPWR